MFVPRVNVKRDPQRRWAQPDRRFFACGACHILAHAYLERFPASGFRPFWIRPRDGFTGNHVFVTDGSRVFDYHGYSAVTAFLRHYARRGARHYPGWDAEVVPVQCSLISGEGHPLGLYLLTPDRFLHDPVARARRFLERFDHDAGRCGAFEQTDGLPPSRLASLRSAAARSTRAERVDRRSPPDT